PPHAARRRARVRGSNWEKLESVVHATRPRVAVGAVAGGCGVVAKRAGTAVRTKTGANTRGRRNWHDEELVMLPRARTSPGTSSRRWSGRKQHDLSARCWSRRSTCAVQLGGDLIGVGHGTDDAHRALTATTS